MALVMGSVMLYGCAGVGGAARYRDDVVRVETRKEAISVVRQWAADGVGRYWSPVAGTGSMRPAIDEKCLVLLESVRAVDLRKHDIAIYARDLNGNFERTVIHRVVAVDDSGYVLFTGDANSRHDGWIAPWRVMRRVIRIVRFEED